MYKVAFISILSWFHVHSWRFNVNSWRGNVLIQIQWCTIYLKLTNEVKNVLFWSYARLKKLYVLLFHVHSCISFIFHSVLMILLISGFLDANILFYLFWQKCFNSWSSRFRPTTCPTKGLQWGLVNVNAKFLIKL